MRHFLRTTLHTQLTAIEHEQHHETPFAISGVPAANQFYAPGWSTYTRTQLAMVADTLYYMPIYLGRARTPGNFALELALAGAGGSVLRQGIYAATMSADGEITPGDLELDAGTVAADSTGIKTIANTTEFEAGYHFLAASSDGAPTPYSIDTAGAFWAPVTPTGGSSSNWTNLVLTVVVADGKAALPDPGTAPTGRLGVNRAWTQFRD